VTLFKLYICFVFCGRNGRLTGGDTSSFELLGNGVECKPTEMQLFFCPVGLDIQRDFFFLSFKALPVCPSDENSREVEMRVKHWWN